MVLPFWEPERAALPLALFLVYSARMRTPRSLTILTYAFKATEGLSVFQAMHDSVFTGGVSSRNTTLS
jgi:hypothetical protein